jgi:hypothetical protein
MCMCMCACACVHVHTSTSSSKALSTSESPPPPPARIFSPSRGLHETFPLDRARHIATAHQRSRTASASKSSSPLPSSAGTIPAQSSSVGAYSSGACTLFAPLACSASSQACTRRMSSGVSASRGSVSSSAWCQGCITCAPHNVLQCIARRNCRALHSALHSGVGRGRVVRALGSHQVGPQGV